ncbi:MAG: N-acetylneuraminate synthase family protein, partial [Kiritimatiellae bacterium]|nr:N-acetylneuraminate synthase family protein [Kiritimatiellia bacterium]
LAGGSNIYSAAAIDDCTNIHTRHDYLMACRNLSEHADAILIGDRPVGNAHPMFVIAEGACNHLCQMDLAYQMIDKAVEAGADAIKFQTYKAEKLVTDQAVAFWGEEKIRQIENYRRLDRFDKRAYQDLFAYAKEKGIIGFSSPFDDESADMLNELGMEVFKIASCEVPNKALITRIASYQKPVILSTGASGIDEINRAIDAVLETGNTRLILLACTLSYPTQLADANLRRITTLKEIYKGFTVGLSDHTEPESSMAVPAAATALGAKVIEKHYTLDRTMTGSGHFFALDPNDLANLVRTVRTTESILGDGSLGIADSEQAAWNSARRSIVASRDIPAGEILSDENLAVKRPGGGWPVEKLDEIKGWVATRPIQADERLSDDNAAPCVSN